MIATALQIQNATGEAVTDISTMIIAKSIFDNFNEMTQDEMANALFAYSAHLSSLTATLVTGILLTEAQLDEMVSEIKEFDELGKEFN
jgi:hypothetical protein